MHLSFFPTLGSSTSLALPPRTDGRLIFQAKFLSREEYDQAQRDGIRIELWANLPSEGSGSEAWGSWLFQKIDPGAPSIIGSTVDSTVLLSDSDEATPLAQEHVLYLQVPVRLQSSTCSTFSFTYRLVYPSGSIHWLGEFGHNGHLSIEPRHSAVSLVDGWGEWENGTCTFKNVSSPLALVGRLNMEYGWSIWAVEQESWPIFCPTIREIPSASCVVLSPLSRLYEVIAPQPLILSASPGTSIHITSTGDILHTSGDASGYVVLRSFNALFDDAFLNDTNHSHTGGSHILSDHRAQSTYAIIASRVPRDAMPVCLTMIPLLASGLPLQAPELPVSMSNLSVILPQPHTPLVVFNPSARKGLFISSAHKDHITFRVGKTGAQVIFMPSSTIEVTSSAGKRTWNLSLLSPHTNASVRTPLVVEEEAQLLPTPPPSPPPMNAVPATSTTPAHSQHLPQDAPSSVSPTETLNSPDDVPASSPLASWPDAPHFANTSTSTSYTTNLALVRSRSASPLPRSFLYTFLTMLTWFTRAFLNGLASFWLMADLRGVTEASEERDVDNRADVEQDDDGVDEEVGTLVESRAASGTGGTSSVVAKTPSLEAAGDTNAGTGRQSQLSDNEETGFAATLAMLDVPVPQTATPSLISMFPQDVMRSDTPRVPAVDTPTFSADIRSACPVISLLVRAPPSASPADVSVTLDEKPLSKARVTELEEESTYYLEFDAPTGLRGGHLEVTVV